MISVIVPVLHEENNLPAFLAQTTDWPVSEVVVVDGGSNGGCERTATSGGGGASAAMQRFLIARRGRGIQMNAGAEAAIGDPFLFLHADSIFPSSGFKEIAKVLQDTNVVGGAFRLKIDSPSLFLKGVSMMANLRSSLLGLHYGDQGIFVRKEVFRRMGGYQEWPLMEDVDFIQRLKREGQVVLLKKTITTSARRWEGRHGLLRPERQLRGQWKRKYLTSVRNVILLLLYFMGVRPEKLARWYN